jgi:hypothetical protein
MRERRGQQDEIGRVLQSTDQSKVNQEALHPSGEEAEPLLTGPEPEKTEIIHVYVVREGEEEEPLDEHVVESTLTVPEDGPLPSFDAGGGRFFPTAGDRRRTSRDRLYRS